MKIAIIDCYDSFTYNLVHYLEQLTDNVDCIRNDKVDVNSLGQYNGIILSPGPGLPYDTKNLHRIIETWEQIIPILGVCLGHQAIGTYYGLDLVNMPEVHHGIGRTTLVKANDVLYNGLPTSFISGRYHSWVLSNSSKTENLIVNAIDFDGEIMGISHVKYNIKGLQFHPESILTEHGFKILKNWVGSINL
jgi:anthranilate synthase component II